MICNKIIKSLITLLALFLLADGAGAYPPPAILKINGNEQTSGIGNNCWKVENQTYSICSDTFSIITPVEPLLARSPFTAHLHLPLQEPPEEVGFSATRVTDDDELKVSGNDVRAWRFVGKEGNWNKLPSEPEPDINLLLEPGLYVLNVFVKWEEKGDVSYGFLVKVLASDAAGAVPAEEWDKTFGGAGDDIVNSVQQTSDGGYVGAGYTNSYGAGNDDAWLIKTDGNGNEVWNRTFGGAASDKAESVQQTPDGGYVLSGETHSYGNEGNNSWIIKTDANGSELWNRTLKGRQASSVWQTSDRGLIITGGSGFSMSPPFTIWLVKTDENGNELWNRTFESGKGDFVNSVQQIADGGYIVAGGYYSYYGTAAWIIKTDTYGNQLWSKEFMGKGCPEAPVPQVKPVPPVIGSTMANAIQQTSDGGYIIAGHIEVYTNCDGGDLLSDSEVLLIKTDENGNEQWNRTFGRDYEDEASSVWQVTDGGYIISGSKCSIKVEQCDVWLIRTDANGNEIWNKTFGGTENERTSQIQQTQDGGYIIAGTTNSYGSGGRDAWLIKLGGVSIEMAETPTGSPTETLVAGQTQAKTVVPAGTNKLVSLEKTAGFEASVAITILLAVYTSGRKRR